MDARSLATKETQIHHWGRKISQVHNRIEGDTKYNKTVYDFSMKLGHAYNGRLANAVLQSLGGNSTYVSFRYRDESDELDVKIMSIDSMNAAYLYEINRLSDDDKSKLLTMMVNYYNKLNKLINRSV